MQLRKLTSILGAMVYRSGRRHGPRILEDQESDDLGGATVALFRNSFGVISHARY